MFCKKCASEKAEAEFYHYQPNECKVCICKRVQANRAKNVEHYRQFDRERSMRLDRVAARALYIQTERGKKSHANASKKYGTENAEKKRAQTALNNAIRAGRISPWPVCALPECSKKPQAHHPDYSLPFDVVWLCPMHHKQTHALARLLVCHT